MTETYSFATEDPLGVTGEIVSLILVLASFLIITYLASKTRSRRSFQFEMFLFTVVLVGAEVPRIAYSLGVVDLDPLSTIGLGIHSVSMVILLTFLVFRVRGFVMTSHVLSADFAGVVENAINGGIADAVGEPTMKAINFYVDSQIGLSDPDGYARSLGKIFGSGSTVLLEKIVKSVCAATKTEKRPGLSLAEAIKAGREQFMSTGSPLKP